ncbi:MAG: hypothetical protein ACK550_14280, partial [Synechococcaceae cyanobacterium]
DAIGRHNIDEQNVPPDRLVAEPGKAAFSASERVTVPEGMARDPNGATDLAAIEAQIRKITAIASDGVASGSWNNWRGLGLLGTRFGSSQWFDLNGNADDGLELLITSGGTIQERIDRALPIWGIDLDNDGLMGSNGVYGAAALQIRNPNGLLPAYQNELVIAADTPMAVSLSAPWTVTAPNPLGATPPYNPLGYTVAAGTYAWRNDLVWVDSDGDGRLSLPLTNRPTGTAPNQEPAGPFDVIRPASVWDGLLNLITPGTVKPLSSVGDVVDAGGWELVEQLFYAGEPTNEAATGRVVVSINTSIPGSALYLNTTRSEDLDGDGEARFDEAGTGFREITVLVEGVASASSPQVVGGDPSRDRRYPGGLKAQLNPSYTLVPTTGSPLSHRLLQAGWRSSGAGNLSFEAWGYNLQAQTDGAGGRVVDLTGTPATALRLQIPSASPSWRNDSSLAPLWSLQNANAEPDLLLGNWLWLDPGTAASPVAPIQLVPAAAAEGSEQVRYSPLQTDWSSVVLESTGWPLNDTAPLWAFLSGASDGSQDSFSRFTKADGEVSSWEGQYRQALLSTALTPEANNDVIALQVSDLASGEGTIQATGAINRLQDLGGSGVVFELTSAQGQQVLLAGLNRDGLAEFRISDPRGLPLARVEVAGIKRLNGVGWFSPERAWALVQEGDESLQLLAIELVGSSGDLKLVPQPLATLASDSGLLSRADQAQLQTAGDGLVLSLPLPITLGKGDAILSLTPPDWLKRLSSDAGIDLVDAIRNGKLNSISLQLDPTAEVSQPSLQLLALQLNEKSDNATNFGWISDSSGQIWQVQILHDTDLASEGSLVPKAIALTPLQPKGEALGKPLVIKLASEHRPDQIGGVAISAEGVLISGLDLSNYGYYSESNLVMQWLPLPADKLANAAAGKPLQIADHRSFSIRIAESDNYDYGYGGDFGYGIEPASAVTVEGLLAPAGQGGGEGFTVYGQGQRAMPGYLNNLSGPSTPGAISSPARGLWTLQLPSLAELELLLATDKLSNRVGQLRHAIVDVAGLSLRDLSVSGDGVVLAVGGHGDEGSSLAYSSAAAEGFVSLGSTDPDQINAVQATLLETPAGLQARGLKLTTPDPAEPKVFAVMGELYAPGAAPVLAVWSSKEGIQGSADTSTSSSALPLAELLYLDEDGKRLVREDNIQVPELTAEKLRQLRSPELLAAIDEAIVVRDRQPKGAQWLITAERQWLVPEAYGELLQISADGQAISRRPDGSLELLRFDASKLFGSPLAARDTSTERALPARLDDLPLSLIRQRHARSDRANGEPVLAAQLQQVQASSGSDRLITRLDLLAGPPARRELVQLNISNPDALPLASPETVVIRRLAAGDRNGDGSEESLLLQCVIQRPDAVIAGAVLERPLLLLRTSGSGDAAPGSFRFDLDLTVSLEGLSTSRGTSVARGASLSEASALWVSFDPRGGFREGVAGSSTAPLSILLAGNTSDSPSPRQADPLLALLQ